MRTALTAAILFCLAAPAWADDGWMLLGADFRQEAVNLDRLDESGVRIVPAGRTEEQQIPLDHLLKLERLGSGPAAALAVGKGKYTLFLQGGDHITGDVVGLQDEVLTWQSSSLGQMKISIRQVRAISKLDSPPGLDEDAKEDRVLLANRDTVRGIITGIADGKLSVQAGNDVVPVPVAVLTTMYFASAGEAPQAGERAFRVRFTDDSSLRVAAAQTDGKVLLLTLADGSKRQMPLAAARSIEQLNGPVSWLAAHVPSVNEQVWFSDATYPAQLDVTISAIGRSWAHGIAAHADSKLGFPLDGSHKAFRTQFSVDPQRNARGGVLADLTVRILLDDKVVYEQKNVRAGKISPVVNLELGDARQLTLEVLHNDATASQGWLDWLEPALLRNPPATQEAPATQP